MPQINLTKAIPLLTFPQIPQIDNRSQQTLSIVSGNFIKTPIVKVVSSNEFFYLTGK